MHKRHLMHLFLNQLLFTPSSVPLTADCPLFPARPCSAVVCVEGPWCSHSRCGSAPGVALPSSPCVPCGSRQGRALGLSGDSPWAGWMRGVGSPRGVSPARVSGATRPWTRLGHWLCPHAVQGPADMRSLAQPSPFPKGSSALRTGSGCSRPSCSRQEWEAPAAAPVELAQSGTGHSVPAAGLEHGQGGKEQRT